MCRLWWCMVLPFVFIAPALGQDPVKVDPQHVEMEFENEFVRILRVRLGPHEKIPMHEHSGRVVVSLTETDVMTRLANGTTAAIRMGAGEARWAPPLSHAAENLHDTSVELIEIELKGSAPRAK